MSSALPVRGAYHHRPVDMGMSVPAFQQVQLAGKYETLDSRPLTSPKIAH